MAIVLVIAFIGGLIVLIGWIAGMNNKKVFTQFGKISEKFKLNHTATPPKGIMLGSYLPNAYGAIGDQKVKIYSYTTGYGRNRQFWTGVKVSCPNNQGNSLKLYKEGFFSKIGKAFGGQDIPTGDEQFDKDFILKSSNEVYAKNLLTDPIRRQAQRVWLDHKASGTLTINANVIDYAELGLLNSDQKRERLEMLILLMKAMSDRLIEEGGMIDENDSGFFDEKTQG